MIGPAVTTLNKLINQEIECVVAGFSPRSGSDNSNINRRSNAGWSPRLHTRPDDFRFMHSSMTEPAEDDYASERSPARCTNVSFDKQRIKNVCVPYRRLLFKSFPEHPCTYWQSDC